MYDISIEPNKLKIQIIYTHTVHYMFLYSNLFWLADAV